MKVWIVAAVCDINDKNPVDTKVCWDEDHANKVAIGAYQAGKQFDDIIFMYEVEI